MKFNEWPDLYHVSRSTRLIDKTVNAHEFYSRMASGYGAVFDKGNVSMRMSVPNSQTAVHLLAEWKWLSNKKPFYNVWPKVIPMFIRLNLEGVTGTMISMRQEILLLRFPAENNPLSHDGQTVRSMLLHKCYAPEYKADSLFMVLDLGETDSDGYPIMTTQWFPLINEKVSDQVKDMQQIPADAPGIRISPKLQVDCIKLALTVLLIDDDPELISRIVLKDDEAKYETTGDEKYVLKAEKRGVVGWDIGRRIEVSPHYRTSHCGIRWCGVGRTIPKLTRIKGSFIHKSKITTIPTGYQDKDTFTDDKGESE